MVCSQGESPIHHSNPMNQHPSRPHLYKRVKHLTNIGEHEEASALLTDLLARKFEAIDRHRPTPSGAER